MASEPNASDEIRRFEEQYRSNPEGLVFARLADAYRKAGELDRALSLLKDGIARHPDYPSAHIVRARTLVDLDRPSDAEASLRRVLELDGQNLVAMRGLASLAETRQDPLEAVHWYEQISALDPMNVEAEAALERLRRELPPTPPGLEPLPAPSEEWWSSPAFELAAPRGDEEEPVDFSADGLGVRADHAGADGAGTPEADESPAADEPRAADEPPEVPGTEGFTEAAATLEAAVEAEVEARESEPPSSDREAPRAWWFEDPADDEPADDGDLLTRTMAELYVKQGLVDEAIAIYRELVFDRPEDADLRRALADLRERTEGEQVESVPASAGAAVGEAKAAEATAVDAESGGRSRARGADRAGKAADADPAAEAGSGRVPYASHPVPRTAGESEMYRDWIRRLSE